MGGLELVVYLVTGFLIGGAGGAMVFWALFGDRLQGGHKQERCPKCWYALPGQESLERAKCSECGWSGPGRQVHSSRRRWKWVLAACVILLVGAGVAIWPQMRGGNWFYLLPESIQLRLWPTFGPAGYFRDVAGRWSVDQPPPIDGEEIRAARRTLGAGSAADRGAALSLLTAAQVWDDSSREAAIRLLSQTRDWMGAREAIEHLQMAVPDVNARVACLVSATQRMVAQSYPRAIFEELERLEDSKAARAALVSIGFSSNEPLAGTARYTLNRVGSKASNEVLEYLAAISDDGKLNEVIEGPARDFFRFQTRDNDAFLVWSFRNYHRLTGVSQRVVGPAILEIQDFQAIFADIDRVEEASDDPRASLVTGLLAKMKTFPPGVVHRAVMQLNRADAPQPEQVWDRAVHCAQEDSPILLRLLAHRDWRVRRQACSQLIRLRLPLDEVIDKLQGIQGDPTEREEVRVEARDSLRKLRVWREGQEPKPSAAPITGP